MLWGNRLTKDKFKVGICWQGSKNKIDIGRSFPLSLFKGISKLRGLELISLHKGEGEKQINDIDFDLTILGDDFDSALLNGALVEAIRFMKGEADMIALYQKMYMEAITLLGALGDNKLREDAYRSGQYRMSVA